MTEPHSGLRFDIYERVHLSQGLSGIRELDHVELLPHIQVVEDKEQALLKGNLWLTGKYVGEDDSPNLTLEHFIPVEITLPYNRVNRLEDLRVEIENFDIDLISTHSLNVTGVLSLRGIEMSAAPHENWEDQQEAVFVHKTDRSVSAERDGVPAVGQSPEPDPEQTRAEPVIGDSQTRLFWGNFAQEPLATQPEQAEEANTEAEAGADVQDDALEDIEHLQDSEPETKPEMVIAFGAKPDFTYDGDLKSLIQPGDYREPAGDASKADSSEAAEARNDRLEWKKLFLSSDRAETQFRKLRIVIVQKTETIEQIAQRCRVNQREIALLNRLGGKELEEGQLLYIPEIPAAAGR